jgi:hypothetical protein
MTKKILIATVIGIILLVSACFIKSIIKASFNYNDSTNVNISQEQEHALKLDLGKSFDVEVFVNYAIDYNGIKGVKDSSYVWIQFKSVKSKENNYLNANDPCYLPDSILAERSIVVSKHAADFLSDIYSHPDIKFVVTTTEIYNETLSGTICRKIFTLKNDGHDNFIIASITY